MAPTIAKFQVRLVALNPARGAEMRKSRPALVISPNEMNRHLSTLIIAPMTTTLRAWPFRVDVAFDGKRGQVALDQLRSIDKSRCQQYLGDLPITLQSTVTQRLQAMFSA